MHKVIIIITFIILWMMTDDMISSLSLKGSLKIHGTGADHSELWTSHAG